MNASPPFFSVVVPTWNDAGALTGTLQSVLEQSFEEFELVVVDDGSTDDTRARVEALEDPRIRYLHQEHTGVAQARNRGLRAARGHHLVFLDSDDRAHRDWLASFAETFRKNDRVALVCCGLLRHGLDGELREELPNTESTLFDNREVLFLAGTFAVQRSVLMEVGGYRTELFFSENTELGIRLVQHCTDRGLELRALRKPLLDYHPRQLSRLECRRQRQKHRLAAIEYLFTAHPERFRQDPALYEVHLTLAGTTAVRAGRPEKSHRFLRAALRLRPRSWKHWLRWLISYLPGVRSVVWTP